VSIVHLTVDSHSLEASVVPLPPTPLPLESSQTLTFTEQEGLDDIFSHSFQSIGQVDSVDNDVFASSALAPV
jgi:hypothetical protein